jgi:hypothetical protein
MNSNIVGYQLVGMLKKHLDASLRLTWHQDHCVDASRDKVSLLLVLCVVASKRESTAQEEKWQHDHKSPRTVMCEESTIIEWMIEMEKNAECINQRDSQYCMERTAKRRRGAIGPLYGSGRVILRYGADDTPCKAGGSIHWISGWNRWKH